MYQNSLALTRHFCYSRKSMFQRPRIMSRPSPLTTHRLSSLKNELEKAGIHTHAPQYSFYCSFVFLFHAMQVAVAVAAAARGVVDYCAVKNLPRHSTFS
jgi:hypothetical protein